MKIYIDSADRYEKKVQLLDDDGKVVSEKTGDLEIVPTIRDLLSENNINLKDIEIFDVNKGPGSFTGLKMGVTIANILNWVHGKKKIEELVYPEYGSEPNIHKTKWLEK